METGSLMPNFSNVFQTQLLFGQNQESEIGRQIKYLSGSKVLLHYAKPGGPIEGLLDNVRRSLRSAGLDYVELSGVDENPRVDTVIDAVKLCKRENVDFILGVGSVNIFLSSKIIAASVKLDGNFYSLFSHEVDAENVLPLGLISTTVCGGVANVGKAAVFSKLDDGSLKFYELKSPYIAPKFIVYNPDLCLYDDKDLSYSIVRILTVLLRRYFTPNMCEMLSERIIESTMSFVLNIYERLRERPYELELVSNLMWASINSNINRMYDVSSSMSLEILSRSISAVYDCPFEQSAIVVMLAFLEFSKTKSATKLAQLGYNVFNVRSDFSNVDDAAKRTVKAIKDVVKELGLPTSLQDLHGSGQDIKLILNKAGFPEVDTIGDFEKLNKLDCEVILSLAI